MEGKLSIIVDNGMTRIASALKADDNVGLLCQHVRYFSFSLITPVSTYDCSNH